MRVVVLGAGGHARSVIAALGTGVDGLVAVACTSPDAARHGRELDGVPIVGGDNALPGLLADGVRGACLGVGGTSDNGPRRQLYEDVRGLGFSLPPLRHGAAVVADTAWLDEGAQILAGALVGPGARIGANSIVNSGAIVEHDCEVGAHVHIASGCTLAGTVRVGEAAHVGAGATILQGVTIGDRAIVGAGAVVITDLAADHVAVGVPAVARRRKD